MDRYVGRKEFRALKFPQLGIETQRKNLFFSNCARVSRHSRSDLDDEEVILAVLHLTVTGLKRDAIIG